MVAVDGCVVGLYIDDTIYPLSFAKDVKPSIAMSVTPEYFSTCIVLCLILQMRLGLGLYVVCSARRLYPIRLGWIGAAK